MTQELTDLKNCADDLHGCMQRHPEAMRRHPDLQTAIVKVRDTVQRRFEEVLQGQSPPEQEVT